MACVHRFSSVLLVDRRGWLLLQERDEHPVIDPDKWGLVGGHVDDGEDFEPAAYRELAEETGLVLAPGTLRLFREIEVFHEGYGTLDTAQIWYAGTDCSDADVVASEGRQIVFVPPEQARGLDLAASAAVVVPAFLDSEEYRELVA